jgi:hypothetical protein
MAIPADEENEVQTASAGCRWAARSVSAVLCARGAQASSSELPGCNHCAAEGKHSHARVNAR